MTQQIGDLQLLLGALPHTAEIGRKVNGTTHQGCASGSVNSICKSLLASDRCELISEGVSTSKQVDLYLSLATKRMCQRHILCDMGYAVPLAALVVLITTYMLEGKRVARHLP